MSKNTGTSELINYFDLGVNGDVGIAGSLDINTIANATTDTDTFLVSDTGIIKYRTGAQLLSDIGAAPATGGSYLPLSGGILTGTTRMDGSGGTVPSITMIYNSGVNRLLAPLLRLYGATNESSNYIELFGSSATSNRTINFPDASGTVALTSNLSGYLPLTGGTLTGSLIVENNAITQDGTRPIFTLQQSGTTKVFLGISSGASDLVTGDASGDAVFRKPASSGAFRFSVDGGTSSALTILSNGKVGIGTGTPDNSYQGLTISGSDPSLRLKTTSGSGWVWTEYVTSAGVNNFSMGVNQTIPYFGIKAGAGLDNPNFAIVSSGNVLIGTTTDGGFKLDVAGTGRFIGPNVSNRGQLSIQSNNVSNAARASWYYDTTLQGNIGTTSGDFYVEAVNNLQLLAAGNISMGTQSVTSFSKPFEGQLIGIPNAVIVSGIIALGSPYTQNIQIDIVYNNWGGNNVIGLVDMIITLREFANVSGTAFGKVFATNSGSGSTFASFNTSNVTTSQCSVTASSGGNYTLRITIDPSNITDRGSYYLVIPNGGGTGSTINSVNVSFV